mgnify:CR=1 FL=1
MTLRLLHTADWQLGKPFGHFDADTKARLQEARFDMIGRIAAAARSRGVRHILVAGDVFDQEQPADRTLRRAMDRMAEAHDCTFWLLPGNHDPAGPLGLWPRLTGMGLPGNVMPLTEPVPVELAPGVLLLPAPWTSKRPGRDLTAWFSEATTDAELRVGLAHGPVQAFGSDPDLSGIISADRADTAGLTYLALGDWHGHRRAGPRAFYAGTPEADSFKSNAQGHALLVDLARPDSPEPLPVGAFTWRAETLAACPEWSDLAPLDALIAPEPSPDRQLLRLSLTGSLSLELHTALDEWTRTQAARLAWLEVDRDALGMAADPAELERLIADGMLRDVAMRLQAMESAEARDALELLGHLAQR